MIEINNLTDFEIDDNFLKEIVKRILSAEKSSVKAEISIALIDSSEIQALNKKYRKKNKPTDVLSFVYFKNKKLLSGEIIICPEIVKKNAKTVKSSFEKELYKVLIHGILHLFGFDHEKTKIKALKMSNKQDYYFSQITNK